MNHLKYLGGLTLALMLSACGGGAPDTTAPVSPAVVPTSVEVIASSNSILSAGSEVLLTAIVKNASNAAMPNQPVTFRASSGSLLSVSTTTDGAGVAVAKLSAGSDKSARSITVSVEAGTVSGSIALPVVGTRVTVTGAGTLQAGSAGSYTVRALDSSGNPIANANVSVSSTSGIVSPPTVFTDASGNGTFSYSAINLGPDTIQVSALGTSAQTAVIVSGIDFSVVSPAPGATTPVNTPLIVTVRFRNSGVGVAGQTVNFTTTRGVFSAPTATTNAAGEASASVVSSTAGPATVSAVLSGGGQVTLPIQFLATTPATLILQANPGAVSPNPSGTNSNQSTLEAIVRDAAGNSVAGQLVNFVALQDVSNGTLQPGSALTDINGRAQVQFIPGGVSTSSDGVLLQATVAGTNVSGTASLTVNGQALFINLGYGNTISNVDPTTYSVPFSVYVTDANGNAVGNQQVTLSAIPDQYRKGQLGWSGTVWAYAGDVTSCPNEDLNRNGILDAGEDTNGNGILDAGEDTNGNGLLTPGNPATPFPGTVTTDAEGRAVFGLRYGEQFAPWVDLRLSARATVGGTESRSVTSLILDGLASDFNNQTAPPAGVVSPYGRSTSCSNPN